MLVNKLGRYQKDLYQTFENSEFHQKNDQFHEKISNFNRMTLVVY